MPAKLHINQQLCNVYSPALNGSRPSIILTVHGGQNLHNSQGVHQYTLIKHTLL